MRTTNLKNWETVTCKACAVSFPARKSRNQSYCSINCRSTKKTWNKGIEFHAIKGEKNGNWKGGISPINALLNTIEKKERNAGRPRCDVCEICYKKCKTFFDHDHQTNTFRGWICRECNLALGYAKDQPWLLRRMAQYLVNTNPKTAPNNILEQLYKDHGRF